MTARADILRSSRVAYDAFIEAEDLATAIEWSPVGALFVCREAATMDDCAQYFGLVAEFDMNAVPLAGAELAAKEPAIRDDVAGAWYFDLDAHLRPDRLMREWHRVNLERGVIVSENSAVSAIHDDDDKITGVSTSSGTYTADSVVVATGAWSSQVAGMFHTQIPIEPGKGYSITTSCPQLSPVYPCAFQERRCIATPFQSGYRLGGTMEFSGFDPRLRQNRISAIRRAASEYLKEPEGD
ncbi:MAG: FAD-dependent oxidoreductase, partial [Lentisphaeria bacterium]|nr:FAD-dependent oxidoreductase [Lentisphaeria bacterium]